MEQDSFAAEFHNIPFMNFETKKIDKMGDYSSMTGLINIYNKKVDEDRTSSIWSRSL